MKKQKQGGKERAWIELSREALRRNVILLTNLLPEGCQLMPAVKADAYGHGAAFVAKCLNEMGIGAFCVATVSEGAELRRKGIKGEILVLGYTHPTQFPLLSRHRLMQTVADYSYAQTLNDYGRIKVHIKMDTGMHRLGERAEKTDHIRRIFQMKNLTVEGIYTHLCATEKQAFTEKQGEVFYRAVAELREEGCSIPKVHLLASYGLLHYPELAGNYARVGIALYGLLSSRGDLGKCAVKLTPVLSLKARVVAVKELLQGESAGYGLAYVADRKRKIAVLAIGYADGLPRSLSCGTGSVLIKGKRAPVAGRICMDFTTVDITSIQGVKQGDVAVIIGREGGEEITAYDLAEQSGTITNEVVSRLGKRLERILI